MYIVVHHNLEQPEDFWASAQRNLPKLPEGGVHRIVNIFPNQTMDKATCVWEADSIENLQKYLQEKLGAAPGDTFFQINETTAVGLDD